MIGENTIINNISVIDRTSYQRLCLGEIIYTPEELLRQYPDWGGFKNLDEDIYAITLVRHTEFAGAHWEVYLHAVTTNLIKVDLIRKGYRVIYGAIMPLKFSTAYFDYFELDIELERTVNDVFKFLVHLAILNGPWKGLDGLPYDCQDFALNFMRYFGLSDGQLLKYELRHIATRRFPPLITEYNDKKLRFENCLFLEHNY